MAIAALITIIIVAGAWLYLFKIPNPQLPTGNVILTNSQGQDLYVNAEIADTPIKISRGLMNRTSLEPNAGMLFTLSKERRYSVWMKNMLIPIDVMYISGDGNIVDIKHELQPCKTPICPNYKSSSPIKYALEVNSGYAKQNNLNIGNKVTINDNRMD